MSVWRYQEPLDTEHRPRDMGTLYYGIKSLLKFEVTDRYGNLIEQITDKKCCDVTIKYCDDNSSDRLQWKIRNGTIFALFSPKMVGKMQMVVHFVDRRPTAMRSPIFATSLITINVIHPPCSPSLSLKFLDDNLKKYCTAGENFAFDVQFYDVFGNIGVESISETCDVVVKTRSRRKQANVRKIATAENLKFAVAICFKTAGLKKVNVVAKSGGKLSTKDIHVKVLPSAPEHLGSVKYTTLGTVDPRFTADSTVMYRDQWSTLQAVLFDCYNNVVGKLTHNYHVCLKLSSSDNGKEVEIEYKNMEVRKEIVRVEMKITEAGKHNMSVTMTNKIHPEQVFHLKEIRIHVCEPPFQLFASKIRFPNTGVAGEVLHLEILPIDVFGCPAPASSTFDYIFRGDISDSLVAVSENKETVDCKVTRNNLHVIISVSIVLKKAGRRKLVIIAGKDGKSKDTNMQCKMSLFIFQFNIV